MLAGGPVFVGGFWYQSLEALYVRARETWMFKVNWSIQNRDADV